MDKIPSEAILTVVLGQCKHCFSRAVAQVLFERSEIQTRAWWIAERSASQEYVPHRCPPHNSIQEYATKFHGRGDAKPSAA